MTALKGQRIPSPTPCLPSSVCLSCAPTACNAYCTFHLVPVYRRLHDLFTPSCDFS
ncbi:hypothetical protein EV122DRAFT_220217 [Schizophyllum commune]